jgi:hypothetical protein
MYAQFESHHERHPSSKAAHAPPTRSLETLVSHYIGVKSELTVA